MAGTQNTTLPRKNTLENLMPGGSNDVLDLVYHFPMDTAARH